MSPPARPAHNPVSPWPRLLLTGLVAAAAAALITLMLLLVAAR